MSPFSVIARRVSMGFAIGLLAACATLKAPVQPDAGWPGPQAQACADWWVQLDAATDSAGVRDGSAYRIPGFAYLRTDRFLASFRDEVAGKPEAFDAWVGRLLQLDEQARAIELRNLPPQFLPLAGVPSKPEVKAQTQRCARLLAGAVLESETARALLQQRAQVPDDYAGWKRALGLYPLTRIPFFKGVEKWQQQTARKIGQGDGDQAAKRLKYAPASAPLAARRVAAIQTQIKKDVLGIPQPSAQQQAQLLAAYAPLLEIETTGAYDRYDRFGALFWGDGRIIERDEARGREPAPQVNLLRTVVYQRLAYTRWQGQTLLQLVYSVWFPERPRSAGVDLLSGTLDSVVLRVTLDARGAPLLYDSIHSCGCYHLFFATPGVTPLPAPQARMEWAFVAATLPAPSAGQRVVLKLASGSHYVIGLRGAVADDGALSTPYMLVDDNELRALPTPAGGTRSAFWPSGIVPGTERGERLMFWPMGIASPGAMRQWGRQPTAFVGRRHFDDADLLERRFQLSAP
ncbi:MAG: hypothetical protein ABIQ90_00290 [Polaromonas sp.]